MAFRTSAPALLVLLPLVLAACSEGRAGVEPTREVLPNGATLIRYASLPSSAEALVQAELSIGTLDGPDAEVFGDIRGIEADAEGAIYVLDFQAKEIRVFEPDGSFREILARRGEGPGEITDANGLLIDREGVLWVNDHGKMRFTGIRLEDGEEVARVPFPVLSFGFIWDGARDNEGRFWMHSSQSEGPRVFPPPEGLNRGSSRLYMKFIDPRTEAMDSLFVGTRESRSFVSTMAGGGSAFWGIPFEPANPVLLDPEGGYWIGDTGAFRITRLDPAGDTVLILEVEMEALPVTEADHEGYLAPFEERGPDAVLVAREVLTYAPERKPHFDQMFLDDEGQLWVRRVREAGELPFYYWFDRDGEYLGSVELAFDAQQYRIPTVRNGKLYTLVLGEMEVPTVVRASLP